MPYFMRRVPSDKVTFKDVIPVLGLVLFVICALIWMTAFDEQMCYESCVDQFGSNWTGEMRDVHVDQGCFCVSPEGEAERTYKW